MNSSKELREFAAGYLNDNQYPGLPGYCNPNKADWSLEILEPSALTNVFASPEKARAWLNEEIEMDRDDEMHRDWYLLLTEDIREEAVLLIRDGVAHVWDGWHRTAAAIARGIPLKTIVGRPHPDAFDILPEIPKVFVLREALCELPRV
jgi:hypothetical protein